MQFNQSTFVKVLFSCLLLYFPFKVQARNYPVSFSLSSFAFDDPDPICTAEIPNHPDLTGDESATVILPEGRYSISLDLDPNGALAPSCDLEVTQNGDIRGTSVIREGSTRLTAEDDRLSIEIIGGPSGSTDPLFSESVSGKLFVPSPIQITLPERSEQSFPFRDFLVKTRPDGGPGQQTLVGNENRIDVNFDSSEPLTSDLFFTIHSPGIRFSEINGFFEETSFEEFGKYKTTPGQTLELVMTADRRTDGGTFPFLFVAEAKAAFDQFGFNVYDHSRIFVQSQQRFWDQFGPSIPLFQLFPDVDFSELQGVSVIRQQYEDVRYGGPGTDPSNSDPYGGPGETDFMPSVSSDNWASNPVDIPHAADFPGPDYDGASTFQADKFDYFLVQDNVIDGLDDAINNMTQQERQAVRQNNHFYWIYSNYRTPAQNKRAGGIGDSIHMEGRAVDVDTRDDLGGKENDWSAYYSNNRYTNCRALAVFLRNEAGADALNDAGTYETNCPDPDRDGTQDESKVHAAWPRE